MTKVNFILSLIFSIIDAVIFINLLSVFRKNKNDYKFMDIIVIAGISTMILILTLLGIIPYVKVIIVSIALFIITFLYKIKFYERLLLIALYYFIIIISDLLVTLLISNILNIDLEIIEPAYSYSFLTLGVISKFLTIIIVSIVKKNFNDKKIILPDILNYILISILVLSSISMILLFYATFSLSSKSVQLVLFLTCLFILFIGVGTLIIYFYANNFYIKLQKETTKAVYNKSYEKFILHSRKREDTLSKIWHDMNNHIKILKGMTDLENKEQIRYLNSLKEKIRNTPNKINSGNNLINTILNDKYVEANSHEIKFNVKAMSPPKLNIDDLDLSSILFNTIDNAIEACLNSTLKNKYISLKLYPDGNFLYYNIKNSYNIDNHNHGRKIYLNKKDYISEGYGLRIVEDMVEKYDGHMDIDKKDNEYSVTIILHLNTTSDI